MTPAHDPKADENGPEVHQGKYAEIQFFFSWSLGKCLKWLQVGRKLFENCMLSHPANMFWHGFDFENCMLSFDPGFPEFQITGFPDFQISGSWNQVPGYGWLRGGWGTSRRISVVSGRHSRTTIPWELHQCKPCLGDFCSKQLQSLMLELPHRTNITRWLPWIWESRNLEIQKSGIQTIQKI